MSFLDFLGKLFLLEWLLGDDKGKKVARPPKPTYDYGREDDYLYKVHSLENRIKELERQRDRLDILSDRYDELEDQIDDLQDELDELEELDDLDDLDDYFDD